MKKNAFSEIFFYPCHMRFTKNSLFIDIGASFIKIHPLELKLPTPHNANPKKILSLLKTIKIPKKFNSVFVGFPGVVIDGVCLNAPNLSNSSWVDFPLQNKLSALFNRKTLVLNDADLHGYKIISGKGVELVVALGTGVGSAIFCDGKILPNLELGHTPFLNNKSYEQILGLSQFHKQGQRKWEQCLLQAIRNWEKLFNPQKIYLSGGLSLVIKNKKILNSVIVVGNP